MSWASDTWADSAWGAPNSSMSDPDYDGILIIEDGTNVTNSNAFADVTFLDAYHANINNTDWTGSTPDKESAILRFMRWLEGQEHRLSGVRTYENQFTSWPRSGVILQGIELADNIVPLNILKAQAEGSRIELISANSTAPVLKDGGASIKDTYKKLGPMAKSTTYSSPASQEKKYQAIMLYLEPYFRDKIFGTFNRG